MESITTEMIAAAKTDRSVASTLFDIASKAVVYPFFRKKAKPGQVSDLAQEAMMKAWVGLKTFRGNVKEFFCWLRRICFHCLVSSWRSLKQRPTCEELELGDCDTVPTTLPDTSFDVMEILERKELFLCKYLAEGFAFNELSDVTGWCVGTVKSRLHYQRTEFESLLLT